MRLPDALRSQAAACTALGSPFMGRLMVLLADHMVRDSRLFTVADGWPGDIGPSGASLPLRLASGLHALVLMGMDPGLAAVYPPATPEDDAFAGAVLDALARHEDFLLGWMESAPQTNEVRRSAAIIAAAHWIAARHPLPFVTSELGASAGLNLRWDRYALDTPSGRLGPEGAALTLTPDWQGPVPAARPVTVADRRGVDLNPLDPSDPDIALRLHSYLWPDQPERLQLTDAAISARRDTVEAGDAITWLKTRLAEIHPGHVHLIYHTVAWQYFPDDAQARGTSLLKAAGSKATPDAPVAWLGMEADGQEPGAALTLRLWPGGETTLLARVDFHGRWVNWLAT